jgi:hypothetical protein
MTLLSGCGALRPDLQTPGDFQFADAGPVQLSDFGGMPRRRLRPTDSFAVLPGLRQAGSRSLSQNLTFELTGGSADSCGDSQPKFERRRVAHVLPRARIS